MVEVGADVLVVLEVDVVVAVVVVVNDRDLGNIFRLLLL